MEQYVHASHYEHIQCSYVCVDAHTRIYTHVHKAPTRARMMSSPSCCEDDTSTPVVFLSNHRTGPASPPIFINLGG